MTQEGQTETTPSSESTPDPTDASESVEKRWLPQILIGVATFLAVVSVFTVWVRSQALDTDEWVATSDDLLAQPEIREALAAFLVDEIYREVDVTTEVENRLPEDFEGLAGLISSSLRGPATSLVERLVSSDAFRAAWSAANRTSHELLVAILRDETREGISTADGTVTLELGELVRVVGEDLGFSGSLLDDLPEDTGRIVLFESDELATAQDAVAVLDFLAWFTFILVVALYAAAVYLDRNRRLERLRSVGFSLLGVGVFVLILRQIMVPEIASAIVENSQGRPLATITGFVATGLIRQIAWSAVVYGLAIIGFVLLLGSHRWAVAIRRAIAPAFVASPTVVAGVTAVILLVLIWWSPGRAFNSWATGLTLIALVVGAVVALRQVMMNEPLPESTPEQAASAADRSTEPETVAAQSSSD